jgi:hypothetical protein
MVLKRKYSGNYQTASKRRSYKKYPIYTAVATAPAPARVELKYDDGTTSGAISSTPLVILLSTVANGNGSSERIGRRISYYNMELAWIWRFAATHGGPNHCRFTVVYDSSPNGLAPAYTDIFVSTAVQSLQNPDTRGRFKFLYDTRGMSVVNAGTGDEGTWTNFSGHKIISLKGKQAHYVGTGSGIADIEKGAIYLVTNSYQNNVVALDFTNRIQFSDA